MSGVRRIEFIEHTADVGVEVTADTLPDLFRSVADGMFRLLFGTEQAVSPPKLRPSETRRIALDATDAAGLLVAWLRELLHGYEAGGRVPLAIDFHEFDERHLDTEVRFGDGDAPPVREIKGVTYHQLDVHRMDESWFARVIFDV